MCGIAAIFAYDSSATSVNEGELVAIRDRMATRGPDGSGLWFDPARRVGLGHRRLSILDVSEAGAQPMLLPERQLAITFNGEIYNFRELRAALEQQGHQFRSHCDTEILLHLYAEEGEAMVKKLRGMFAFAIWDGVKKSLFLARDQFGIKPLYWADDGQTLRAASQVKALLAGGHIDTAPEPAGHVGFFLWGHVPSNYTMYRGIHNLPAGHCLTFDVGGKKSLRAFCTVHRLLAESEKASFHLPTFNAPAAQELLRSALCDSVQHHLISDVPVGVFLSSGLDSTSIAALASECSARLRTVTLGFEEYKGTLNDETPLAEAVAQQYGAIHQTIWVTRKDFENDLPKVFHAMDQPSCDGLNSYFISRAAAQAGLKVALSGLGGDELFGGYPGFKEIPRAVSLLRMSPHCRPLGRAFRLVSAPWLKHLTSPKYAGLLEYGGTYGGTYLLRRGMFMPWELPGILDADLVREGWNELQTLARFDAMTDGIRSPYLKVAALEMEWYMRQQLLRDADWASMEHSLEVRVPLVDKELLLATAPMLAAEPRPTKRDMALTPMVPLPAAVMNRPKTGFTVPVRDWLLKAYDPSSGAERGLRGWTREVYSTFADNLENHRAALKRRRPPAPALPADRKVRMLVLLTDAYGSTGGIAKFNRDFLGALCSHERVEKVVALPRLMPAAPGPLPLKLDYDTAGLGGKGRYFRAAIQSAKEFHAKNQSGARPLVICGHINLLPVALAVRRICDGNLHLVVHGVDAWKPTPSRIANACVRRISGFIAVSNLTKRRFMRWSRLRDDQGVVLPNCVDVSAFGPGPKSAALLDRYQLRGKTILMTLGRLASEERYKGFDEVLEAMPVLLQTLPGLCYLICGDGQDRPRLVAKAKSLGLSVMEAENATSAVRHPQPVVSSPWSVVRSPTSDLCPPPSAPNVIFTGRISDAEKADHFRLADLYVMPSSGEGFGIVFLEALACGIPVIGSKVDGSREALLNGQLGTLVDPRDPAEICAAILQGLKPNKQVDLRPQTSDLRSPTSDSVPSSALRSPASESLEPVDSVDYFSSARFEQRVHAIVDCISG